ncbi:MAG TPA: endolytic transglycosylase MltG [Mobilitalea sp.]|nr:endolytic transglycosylase MltG [Mobilitalea sp.]
MASSSTFFKVTFKITSFILRLLLNIIFFVLVIVFVIYGSRTAFDFTYQLYGPVTVDPEPGRNVYIEISKGESTMEVAKKLELYRVIKNKYAFYLKTKLQSEVIMPGKYEVNSSMTYDEILDIITDYSKSLVQNEKIDETD